MNKILDYISNKDNAIFIIIYIIGFFLTAYYYGLLSAIAMTAVILFLEIAYGLIIKLIYK